METGLYTYIITQPTMQILRKQFDGRTNWLGLLLFKKMFPNRKMKNLMLPNRKNKNFKQTETSRFSLKTYVLAPRNPSRVVEN